MWSCPISERQHSALWYLRGSRRVPPSLSLHRKTYADNQYSRGNPHSHRRIQRRKPLITEHRNSKRQNQKRPTNKHDLIRLSNPLRIIQRDNRARERGHPELRGQTHDPVCDEPDPAAKEGEGHARAWGRELVGPVVGACGGGEAAVQLGEGDGEALSEDGDDEPADEEGELAAAVEGRE